VDKLPEIMCKNWHKNKKNKLTYKFECSYKCRFTIFNTDLDFVFNKKPYDRGLDSFKLLVKGEWKLLHW
jgi:hypothetical protein